MDDSAQLFIIDNIVIFRDQSDDHNKYFLKFLAVDHNNSENEVAFLRDNFHPKFILLDCCFLGNDEVSVFNEIHKDTPETPIVLISKTQIDLMLDLALVSGSNGILITHQSIKALYDCFKKLLKGEKYLSTRIKGVDFESVSLQNKDYNLNKYHPAFRNLTEREKEVLEELIGDATNLDIAHNLNISTNTVKNHVSSIFRKIKVRNRREAASFARQFIKKQSQ